ncbi:hypothetical protein EB001_03495 [bacterium]|nr:hypothetical protein [bacterium]
MLKNYRNELVAIVAAFGLISYAVYVCAAEPTKTKPVVVTAKKEAAKPVDKKAAAKPAAKKEAAKPVEPAKKDPNRKKPTLKAKYADKK